MPEDMNELQTALWLAAMNAVYVDPDYQPAIPIDPPPHVKRSYYVKRRRHGWRKKKRYGRRARN
jgi:hypothetical protein